MRKSQVSTAARSPNDAPKTRLRSRITNGSELLAGIDGRSAMARRYRDISGQIVSDLGGFAMCSEVQVQLIRRYAATSVFAERLEAALANGEAVDVGEHCQLSSTLTRLASRIGIARRPRPTQTLVQYLAEKNAAETALAEKAAGAPETIEVT